MSQRFSYYDAETKVECYDDGSGNVTVNRADCIDLTPAQAQAFGEALIKCARSARGELLDEETKKAADRA
ncbi:hypothetical protein [Bradyrhizobium genosp. A]|uniref:hypothetical protein n=1 Tax=Bradyrhizobium genosp. A TaxID=83626 RepID=UPI003CF402FC